jgi:hypothetical protein
MKKFKKIVSDDIVILRWDLMMDPMNLMTRVLLKFFLVFFLMLASLNYNLNSAIIQSYIKSFT